MARYVLTLCHGRDKTTLELPEGSDTAVLDVARHIESHFGIPLKSQKLICKGKTLSEHSRLSEYAVRSGSRVMVVGRRYVLEDDAKYKKIEKIRERVGRTSGKLDDIKSELKGVEDGFLVEEFRAAALSKLDRRCCGCNEDLMRCLEELDGIGVEGEHGDLRAARKREVDRIHEIMRDVDRLQENVSSRSL